MVLNVNAIGAHTNLPDHLPACSAGDPCSIARSLPYDLLYSYVCCCVSLMRCVCGVLSVYAARFSWICGSCKQQVHVHVHASHTNPPSDAPTQRQPASSCEKTSFVSEHRALPELFMNESLPELSCSTYSTLSMSDSSGFHRRKIETKMKRKKQEPGTPWAR